MRVGCGASGKTAQAMVKNEGHSLIFKSAFNLHQLLRSNGNGRLAGVVGLARTITLFLS
jgi:hypothetical protein